MQPAVSVIVPMYNAEATIERTLHSVLNQSLRDIEIILVDDASTDRGLALSRSLACFDPRLRIVELATNSGVMRSRAVGVELAKAPHIGFVDADDCARPHMFERLLEASRTHDADITICGADRVSSERVLISPKVAFAKDVTFKSDLLRYFCELRMGTGAHWNKLYRRSVIAEHAGILPRWRQNASEDTLVNIGCFLSAKRVAVIKDVLYEYVDWPHSATATRDNVKAYVDHMRAYAIAVDTYSQHGATVLGHISNLYLRQAAFADYRVSDRSQLSHHRESLSEAIYILLEKFPAGLAVLGDRQHVSTAGSLKENLRNIGKELRNLPMRLEDALKVRGFL